MDVQSLYISNSMEVDTTVVDIRDYFSPLNLSVILSQCT